LHLAFSPSRSFLLLQTHWYLLPSILHLSLVH
jgi:hypothetical protein